MQPTQTVQLVWPSEQYLPGYVAALNRGWSADTIRGAVAVREELVKIAEDPARFLAELVDRERSKLHFEHALKHGRIVIAKLAKGSVGDAARRLVCPAVARLPPMVVGWGALRKH